MTPKGDVLCIHYYFPPIRSGGVIRNYFMSKAFASLYDKVHVITTSNVDVMENETLDIPDNVIIYKAKTTDFRSIKNATNHIKESTKSNFLIRFLIKLKKTLPFHFYIGEGGQQYIRQAENIASDIINANNIQFIYSSFMPYADHKIAANIKKQHSEIPWIADFRDLQVEPIYKNILFPNWNFKQEKRIIQSANLVITVSEGLKKSLRKIHNNVVSIPRGINLRKNIVQHRNKKFTISYTGNLFQHYRDGALFVKSLAQLFKSENISPEELVFIYAGRDGDRWKNWFEEYKLLDYFENRGFVKRDESLTIQNNANALLLLSSSSEEQQGVLTGKFWEYLETGKPIINIINGIKDSEFEMIFDDLEAGVIFYPQDGLALQQYLLKLIEDYKKHKPSQLSEKALENRNQLTWENRAKQVLNELFV